VEICDSKWLSRLTSHFSDPEVGGVYGRQLPQEGAMPMDRFFVLQAYPPENEILSFHGNKIKTKRMVFFSNTNSAIRRSVWEQVKIPEMLKSEDHEWAKRALAAGHKIVYDPEAAVYHSNTYSLRSVFHEYFDTGALMSVVSKDKIVDQSFLRFVRDGLSYEFNQHRYLIQNSHWRWVPYAVAYDTSRFLGAFLGSQQRYMPRWLKRALCKKKNHWDKYEDVIKEPA
jgi:rhamnosyltransferase